MGVNKNIHIDHLEYIETIFKVLNYKKNRIARIR